MQKHSPRSLDHIAPYKAVSARMAISLACAAATAVSVVAFSTHAPAAPGPQHCPKWTAVMVPGTGETRPDADPTRPAGMLSAIGGGLATRYRGDIDIRYLPYPAAPAPYRASESTGVTNLSRLLSGLCPTTRVLMTGYSQGADIVGDQATAIGNGHGPIPASRVAGVGLISDPRRDPATPQLGGPVGGQGIAGRRDQNFGALAGRVRTLCAPGDLYCSISAQLSPALNAMGHAFAGTGTPGLVDGNTPVSTKTGSLDPLSVTRQVIVVLGGLAGFAANIPDIVNFLTQLPPLIIAGNIPALHHVSGNLNNLFRPLVRMAAGVDLHLVAQVLRMAAPLDTSGWTATASLIVGVLAGVDINRVANDIGQAQEVAWRAAERLAAGDPLGGALAITGLVPIAADLAGAAAAALTGDAGTQLSAAAGDFTNTMEPSTSSALADLARQGGQAAQFFTSGIHQKGYDGGAHQLLGWLSGQIDQSR